MARRIRNNFSLQGLDEFADLIEKLGDGIEEVAVEAIDEGVKPMLNQMISNVPVDEGALKRALESSGAKVEGIKVTAYVGFNYKKNPEARHAHLQEFGTVNHPANPFLWPAVKSQKRASLKRIQDTFRRRLDL